MLLAAAVWMLNKNYDSYLLVWQKLFPNLTAFPYLEAFVSDFEPAPGRALRAHFGGRQLEMVACWFHYRYTLHRWMEKHGLRSYVRHRSDADAAAKDWVDLFGYLPFLPDYDVVSGFRALRGCYEQIVEDEAIPDEDRPKFEGISAGTSVEMAIFQVKLKSSSTTTARLSSSALIDEAECTLRCSPSKIGAMLRMCWLSDS
jgi:hypothetical protein